MHLDEIRERIRQADASGMRGESGVVYFTTKNLNEVAESLLGVPLPKRARERIMMGVPRFHNPSSLRGSHTGSTVFDLRGLFTIVRYADPEAVIPDDDEACAELLDEQLDQGPGQP